MSATSSFIAGLLAGTLATLGAVLFWRSSRAAAHRARQFLLAGGLAVTAVVVAAAAVSFTVNPRQAAVDARGESDATGAPFPAAPPSAGVASAAMPSASVMSQVLAGPRAAGTKAAEPMDEAAAALAARLERQGGTAADWSLLAQAYDFLGRPDDARRARARAVQIGAIQRAP